MNCGLAVPAALLVVATCAHADLSRPEDIDRWNFNVYPNNLYISSRGGQLNFYWTFENSTGALDGAGHYIANSGWVVYLIHQRMLFDTAFPSWISFNDPTHPVQDLHHAGTPTGGMSIVPIPGVRAPTLFILQVAENTTGRERTWTADWRSEFEEWRPDVWADPEGRICDRYGIAPFPITITQSVPEPAAIWLLAGAGAAVAAFRRCAQGR